MSINMTDKFLAGQRMPALAIGTMRWNGVEEVTRIIDRCIEHGITYLDTSSCYCYTNEEENSEAWVGHAIKGKRDKVILSAKCSPGNGGVDVGEFSERGFSVQNEADLRKMMEDQMRRMQTDYFDFYQMWSVSSEKVYDSAFKKGGWVEAAMKAKDEGLFKHLGITGHPDNKLMKRWVDDGIFEVMTVPFNILDSSRLEAIEYALSKGVTVLAMNPLAGGMLGGVSPVIEEKFANVGVTKPAELAFKYVEAFGLVSLCGFTKLEQVDENVGYLSGEKWTKEQALASAKTILDMLGNVENFCTGCGYCMPCPEGINIPEVLRLRNYYRLLQLENAKNEIIGKKDWDDGFKLDKCTQCGKCASQCPNQIPTPDLIADALEIQNMK